jgi:hypothetical protein
MHRFVYGFAILAVVIFSLVLVGFFSNLHSTISDFSGGAVSGAHQNFYNLAHGRPFQSSLYASDESGRSVGFSHNPHAYIHWNVYHVHFTPYLLVPLWMIWPNLYWLYGVEFLFTYAGLAFFSWRIIQTLSPDSAKIKTIFALALLLSSSFFLPCSKRHNRFSYAVPSS